MSEDIKSLLERAQPRAVRPLDLSQARARAARRTTVRRVAVLSLGALTLAVASSTALSLVDRGPSDRLDGTVAAEPSESATATQQNYADNMQKCLSDFGWSVTVTADNAFETSHPVEQRAAYEGDQAACLRRFGYDRLPRETAAVRPTGELRMQALGTGTLRADPATGCLWLETEAGKPTMQLLLQGESYRVDFSTSPASIIDGETVVARVDERVEVGGGFTDRVQGVEGCPVTAGTYLGYF